MASSKKNTVITPSRGGTTWTKQDVKDLKSLVKQGNSCKEIAKGLGRTVPSIWMRMSALGLKVKRKTSKK